MNTTQSAFPDEHVFVGYNGTMYLTAWADTIEQAQNKREQFEARGCQFTRVFANHGALGAFRIVGHLSSR